MYKQRSITVIIPALNEEPSIASVINELFALGVCSGCGHVDSEQFLKGNLTHSPSSPADKVAELFCTSCKHKTSHLPLVDTVVVCDNGSIDETATISRNCGAVVVQEPEKGYGAACLAALRAPVDKDLIVFVDGDHSVVCSELPDLLDPLFSGADLVIGSRTLGACESGALTFPQKLGNRFASSLMRLIWKQRITDLGPFRAVSQQTLDELQMQDRQFGWTVEMQVRALQLNKQLVEIPVTTRKRIGQSKISGTIRGVIGASKGILGTIVKLYWRELSSKNTVLPKISADSDPIHAMRKK